MTASQYHERMVISHQQLKEIDNNSLDNIFANALEEFRSFKAPHAEWKFSYTEKLLVPFNPAKFNGRF